MRRLLPAILAVACCWPFAASARQGEISKDDRAFYRRVLADIRKDIAAHYYDVAYRGMNLDDLFRAAGDQLAASTTTAEAVDVVAGVLFRFDDSHTRFIPPPRSSQVDYGWTMTAVGDAVLVTRVDPGSDAARCGLTPGDRVLALNRFQPTRHNLSQLAHYYTYVRPQAQQRVVVQKPDGTQRTFDVKSRVERRQLVELLDAVQEAIDQAVREEDVAKTTDPGILVWRMKAFGESDDIEPFVAKARKAKSLVLDLRGNGGGLIDGLTALVGWTFDRDVHVMTSVGRKGETRETAKPKGKPYLGRLVVLVDSGSASGAEIFARIVQLEKRGTVIGDRTSGQVMVSNIFTHEFGIGKTTFYGVQVTTSDIRMSDGARLERVGVVPDELLLPTPEDLAAGRDPVLARALSMVGGNLTPAQAAALMAGK